MEVNYCYGCMEPLEPGQEICPHCGYDNSTRENQNLAMKKGSILKGTYMIGKVLGKGGFGITYLGLQLNLNIKVAIKEHFPQGFCSRYVNTKEIVLLNSENFHKSLDAFENEARTLAKFQNVPSVVRVTDYFRENDTAYIVMDYVEGTNLKEEIKRLERLPWERVVSLMLPLMQDLEQLHQRKVIHRDIKPDNIKIVRDPQSGKEHLVLLDFGAARSFTSSELTGTYSMILTPGYAPYEQYLQHTHLGPYTDIYALCATMYAAITGKVPPAAPDRMMGDDKLQPFSSFGVDVPEDVEKAVFHGMERNHKDRPQSMNDLYREFYEIQRKYDLALNFMTMRTEEGYTQAIELFAEISGWKDADLLLQRCRDRLDEIESEPPQPEQKLRNPVLIRLLILSLALLLVLAAVFWLLGGKSKTNPKENLNPVTQIGTSLPIESTDQKVDDPFGSQLLTETAYIQESTKTALAVHINTSSSTATAVLTATATTKPTDTAVPTVTATPEPTDTAVPTATATPKPTDTAVPTATHTPKPTDTTVPTATATPKPTDTAVPTATHTPKPTDTAVPTAAIRPTNTPKPIKTVDPSGFSNVIQMVILGEEAFFKGDYETAISYLMPAADRGNAEAQFFVGNMYENGFGVELSDTKAFDYYRMSADQGYAIAQLYLGNLFFQGIGVERSYEKAVYYYQQAAEQGNADALNNLGYMFQYGYGVSKQSFEKAFEYYSLAADKGNGNALNNLGTMYENGNGVIQSLELAVDYYRRAAEQGNADAQFNLGRMYEEGLGVEQSYELAIEYYQQAAEQGNAEAREKVDELLQVIRK